MQTKLSKISNTLLIYSVIFFVPFLWLNYLKVNFVANILISILIVFAMTIIINFFKTKNNTKKSLSKEQSAKIENMSLQFLCSSREKTMDFFVKTFKDKYKISTFNQYLLLDDFAFVPYFETAELKLNGLFEILKINDNKMVITCVKCDKEALDFAKNINREIRIIEQEQLYNILSDYNSFPDFGIEKKQKEKIKLSAIITQAFSKTNAKNYFCGGIFLLVSSFFIRFNIYYTIASTLFLIFAFVSLIKKSPKKEDFKL